MNRKAQNYAQPVDDSQKSHTCLYNTLIHLFNNATSNETIDNLLLAVPFLSWLIHRLSTRRPGLDPGSNLVEYVVDKVVCGSGISSQSA